MDNLAHGGPMILLAVTRGATKSIFLAHSLTHNLLCTFKLARFSLLFGAFDAFSARGWADGVHGLAWWVMGLMGLIELPLEGKPSPLLHSLASTIS